MNDVFRSVIYGIIEGVTEWLPVSSTGHLIVAERFIEFQNVSDGFYEMYSVLIQLGAVLSVLMMFFKRIFPFKKRDGKAFLNKDILSFDFKIAVGCVPAAAAGLALNDIIEKRFYSCRTVAISLIAYGFLFIIVEKLRKNRKTSVTSAEEIDYKRALGTGLFQMLSLIPGTSRSASTVMGGIFCGMSRYAAAEFSFFMAIPVMAGASAVKVFSFGFDFSVNEAAVLMVGFIVSFAVSCFTVETLMNYVKKHTFTIFGIYRIILGFVIMILDF